MTGRRLTMVPAETAETGDTLPLRAPTREQIEQSLEDVARERDERLREYERWLSECGCARPVPVRRYLARWLCVCGRLETCN